MPMGYKFTESISSVLFGGLALETPVNAEPLKVDLDEVIFTLYDTQKAIVEKAFTKRIRFVLFFDGSVRGLKKNAPVEFKGIKVGQVTDIRLEFDQQDTSFRIPVLIEIEPERIIARGESGAGPKNCWMILCSAFAAVSNRQFADRPAVCRTRYASGYENQTD